MFEIPQGTGSGFVWNEQGHVITNFHVIQNASTLRVTLADQSEWEARVVGVAPDQDLAVLFINAPKRRLKPIAVGRSANLQVGQRVFAIGNPFGLDQTLTTGIISALGREINGVSGRKIGGVIQTDAAINPGNSGGPLLDSAGRLIGVNTAIFSPSGSSAGIGFAVPVDTREQGCPAAHSPRPHHPAGSRHPCGGQGDGGAVRHPGGVDHPRAEGQRGGGRRAARHGAKPGGAAGARGRDRRRGGGVPSPRSTICWTHSMPTRWATSWRCI